MADINVPLELAKLIVGVLTPISIACVGWIVNARLKRIEQQQWGQRKLIEKRLEIFERVSPKINQLYCFCSWVGDWKETTPPAALAAKRSLDKAFNIFRFIIGEEAYRTYQDYINTIFVTYNHMNSDAKLRVAISGPDGDRRTTPGWQEDWLTYFTEKPVDKSDIRKKYIALMVEFQSSIGLSDQRF